VADLFVMPTRQEAFGMVFQEAAAAGVPVVATRIAAVPEIVQDGQTGLLVPPGDPAALAHAIRVLIDSAALRRRMGEAAFDRASSLWTIDRYASRLASVVDGIGEGRLQRLSLAAQ
jgi:glycosyltransferase involved in cell wall biosynthesis